MSVRESRKIYPRLCCKLVGHKDMFGLLWKRFGRIEVLVRPDFWNPILPRVSSRPTRLSRSFLRNRLVVLLGRS